jgi:hypothetical protein
LSYQDRGPCRTSGRPFSPARTSPICSRAAYWGAILSYQDRGPCRTSGRPFSPARSLPLVRPQFAPPPACCSILLSNGISLLGSSVAEHLVLGSVRAVRSRGHSQVLRCAAPRPSFQKRYKVVVLYREIVSLFPPTFSCVGFVLFYCKHYLMIDYVEKNKRLMSKEYQLMP